MWTSLVRVDKFSKSFERYLRKDAIHNFINFIIEESKYCSDVIKKHFTKELVMTKKKKKLRTLLNVGSVNMIMLIIFY